MAKSGHSYEAQHLVDGVRTGVDVPYPLVLPANTAPSGGRIILLRHGQTTSNTSSALDTALPGAPLTAMGREQAFTVGELLASQLSQPIVVSSEAVRARHTARLFCRGLAAQGVDSRTLDEPSAMALARFQSQFVESSFAQSRCPDDVLQLPLETVSTQQSQSQSMHPRALWGLKEISAGDYEMRTDRDAHRAYISVYRHWLEGATGERISGGESGDEVFLRLMPVLAALRQLTVDGSDVVVVVHGSLMRVTSAALIGVAPMVAAGSPVTNCRCIVLEPQQPLSDLGRTGWGRYEVRQWGTSNVAEHPEFRARD